MGHSESAEGLRALCLSSPPLAVTPVLGLALPAPAPFRAPCSPAGPWAPHSPNPGESPGLVGKDHPLPATAAPGKQPPAWGGRGGGFPAGAGGGTTASVSLGCRNKWPPTGGLKPQQRPLSLAKVTTRGTKCRLWLGPRSPQRL